MRDVRRRRFVPYDSGTGGGDYGARAEHWAVHIADAVHKALRRHVVHQSDDSGPVPHARRALLANRMRLASQSAAAMAVYVERRATLERAQMDRTSNAVSCSSREEDVEEDASELLCCICLESVRQQHPRKPVQALECGHVFHRACIQQWLRHRRCCPVDRSELHDDQSNDESGNDSPHDMAAWTT